MIERLNRRKIVKRTAIVILLLIAFLVAGITIRSSYHVDAQDLPGKPTMTSTPAAESIVQVPLTVPVEGLPRSSPTASAHTSPTTSPDRPAVWILGTRDRFIALDTQTGQVMNQTGRAFGWRIVATSGYWEYFLQVESKDGQWQVGLAAIHAQRGMVAPTIPLNSFPATAVSAQEDLDASVLTPNGEEALVTLVEKIGAQWVTIISVVDVLQNSAAPPITVFETHTAEWAPPVRAVLSGDGQRLFIAQNFQAPNLGDKANRTLWSTRIAVLNTKEKRVERIIDVPGEIQADGVWLDGALSSDAQMIYLMQNIVRSGENAGYRFVAVDANKFAIANRELVESTETFSTGDGLRFTPDGRYLWAVCNNAFQFLDLHTGRVTQKVPVKRQIAGEAFDPWYTLVSPDKRLVYLIYPVSKEIIAFDLTRRAIVRHAILSESKSSFSNPLNWLGQWLVPTASAKFLAEPGAVLSSDGQRLYFVDVTDMDAGDGIWGINTNSLQPLGQWLKGQDFVGVQLSEDGGELFSVGLKPPTLYVLDALSGELHRALDLESSQPFGFVSDN